MLLMIKNNLTPFFIEEFHIRPNAILVKFKGVNTANEAETLIGTSLYMPLTELPKLKGKNKFYYHDVIEFTIHDVRAGVVGTLQDIVELSSHPVMQIRAGEKEVLIPLVDEFLIGVNMESREITVNTPEGLLDVYLKDA